MRIRRLIFHKSFLKGKKKVKNFANLFASSGSGNMKISTGRQAMENFSQLFARKISFTLKKIL
jgi:hypothetical protein